MSKTMFAVALMVIFSCAPPAEQADLSAVRKVLDDQVAAWNDGSVEEYMKGYWASDSTTFVSGGSVHKGYDALLERYKMSYPDKAAMGSLTFEELDIRSLSASTALAMGIWRLKREKDEPWGRFTLIVEKKGDGWRVTYDHTSSSD